MFESATVTLAFGMYVSLFIQIEPRIFAIVAVVALTLVNVAGIRASTNVTWIMAIIKLVVLAAFAMLGLRAIKTTNFDPFAPMGPQSVLSASAILFFAYTGYARIATLAEEFKKPEKTIPRAILASLTITAVGHVVVSIVGIGLIGVKRFGVSDSPIATAARVLGNPPMTLIIGLGAGVATLSVLLSDLLSSSRTAFATSRNGDLPEYLS